MVAKAIKMSTLSGTDIKYRGKPTDYTGNVLKTLSAFSDLEMNSRRAESRGSHTKLP